MRDVEQISIASDKVVQDAVLFLSKVDRGKAWPAPVPTVVVSNRACEFTPYVQVVPVGARVELVNADPVFHNVQAFAVGGTCREAVGASDSVPADRKHPDERPDERLHALRLILPLTVPNGAKVPVVVDMSHPMEPDHYITRLEVVNERDPIPSKGVFHFTPANGQVFLAFQARMDEGTSEVLVTAECTRHGRWSSKRSIKIADGAGGCASAPIPARARGPDIHPPRIRIPQLVREGRIRRNELIDVQLAIRHPSRTGLTVRDGRFFQQAEPFYLQMVEIFYGVERVSRFTLTPAVSDDPFITFRLRAGREESLRVLFTNSRGQRFEATHPVRLS